VSWPRLQAEVAQGLPAVVGDAGVVDRTRWAGPVEAHARTWQVAAGCTQPVGRRVALARTQPVGRLAALGRSRREEPAVAELEAGLAAWEHMKTAV
jgi:hypothetical protein